MTVRRTALRKTFCQSVCDFIFRKTAEKNKYVIGSYEEKLCPRPWVRPSAAYSRPRAQFFPIRTSQPVNNIYLSYGSCGPFVMARGPRCARSVHHDLGPNIFMFGPPTQSISYFNEETRWPHGQCARLRIERSGFGSWPGTLCCVLGQDTTLTVPLFTQVYTWVPANVMLGVTLRWTSIPSRVE